MTVCNLHNGLGEGTRCGGQYRNTLTLEGLDNHSPATRHFGNDLVVHQCNATNQLKMGKTIVCEGLSLGQLLPTMGGLNAMQHQHCSLSVNDDVR